LGVAYCGVAVEACVAVAAMADDGEQLLDRRRDELLDEVHAEVERAQHRDRGARPRTPGEWLEQLVACVSDAAIAVCVLDAAQLGRPDAKEAALGQLDEDPEDAARGALVTAALVAGMAARSLEWALLWSPADGMPAEVLRSAFAWRLT
jgi:hypothetical protein